MRVTINIRRDLHRKAKAAAAQRGRSLKQFVVDALQEKTLRCSVEPEWMKLFGALGKTKAQRAENRRIEKVIEDAFETLDPEEDY